MIGMLAIWWDGAKLSIQSTLAVGRDGPHAHVGILIMLVVMLIGARLFPKIRPSIMARAAWACAFAAELLNELLDLSWGGPESTWVASSHDVVVTMLPPTLLWLGVRWLAAQFRR